MKNYKLDVFNRGWLAGDFNPSIFKTSDFEVGVKRHKAGYAEKKHHHKLTSELTLVISGQVLMNGIEYGTDDIIVMEPNESTDFFCLTDAITLAVRDGSYIGDRYIDDM